MSKRSFPRSLGAQEGVYVENVTVQEVHDEANVVDLIARGSRARTKGETQVRRVLCSDAGRAISAS